MLSIKRFGFVGLRSKVILLLSLMFLFFTGLATVKEILNFRNIESEKLAEFEWAAKWIVSEEQRHIAQARQVAFLAMNDMRKGLTDQICRKGETGMPGLDPEFGKLAIAEPDGKIFCNTIPWLHAGNVADRMYFRQALNLVDQGYIDEEDSRNPHQYSAIMARAMRDDGHVSKVILVAMDFSWVKEEVDAVRLPASGHLLVVDANGVLVAGSGNLAAWVDKSVVDLPLYRRVASFNDIAFEGAGFSGEESLIVVRKIRTGSGEMHVIVDMPRDALVQPAYRRLIRNLLVSVLAFFAILAWAYSWSEKHFLRKVRILEQATRRVAQGDLTARVGQTEGDELGLLAQSFDGMAETIQSKEMLLEGVNEELYRVNRALRVLSAGNRSLLYAKTEQELLNRICREVVEAGDYLAAWIGFSGASQDNYLRTAAAYSKAEEESSRIDWNTAGNGLQPVITSVREDRVLVINDTGHESVNRHLGEQAAKFGYRSIIILPLHLEDRPFGALILCARNENEFGSTQTEYLKETASDISFGIEMLRTRDDRNRLAILEEHHETMLRNGLEEALLAISRTIEMRDPYTAGHQKRVADLAQAMAKELGLSDEEAHAIYLSAIVHDIGKITVPAEILVKPGKLNDLEYTLVRNHVVATYEILKGIQFPWPIAEMAYQHHERLDGSGYPLGLKGGEILFGARIMAVADVMEAMSSHRPYRPGLGIEVAMREIEKGRGILYDPSAADACLKLIREGRFAFA